MFNIDLRNNTYNAYVLPAQALPSNKKDDKWKMDCMDALENIGLRYLNKYRETFKRNYRIVEGDFRYSDIVDSSLFLKEVDYWRNQAQLTDDIRHYGFIEPIIRQLVSEFNKQPNSIIVDAKDPLSTNDYLRVKTDMLWQSVSESLNKEIESKILSLGLDPNKQDFETQEEQQAYQQQIQQLTSQLTPPEIEKYMNQEYKAVYVEWAENTIEEDKQRFDLDELDSDCMKDYLITGRCFRHHRTGYDYYKPERWSPLNTFTSTSYTDRYPEEGDYIGRIHHYSDNQVISNYGNYLSERHKRDITRSKYGNKGAYTRSSRHGLTNINDWVENLGGTLQNLPFKSYIPYQNAKFIQDYTGFDLGVNDFFPNGNRYMNQPFNEFDEDEPRFGLIRVIEGYWISQRKIGYITLSNELGQLTTEIVTDDILNEYLTKNKIKKLSTVTLEQHISNPQAFTIIWDYLPQTWKGVKICKENTDLQEDLYIGVEPLEFQLKGESDLYHTKLPVTGIVDRHSLVGSIYQRQVDYNIAMNRARDYMAQELGVFYLMDMSFLPSWVKKMGNEESLTKLLDIVRELGILPIDATNQNTRSNFNQFTAVNMDLTQAMLGKLQYANAIKREAFELLGLTQERISTPTDQKTATGVQASLNASFAQTDLIFDRFGKHQKRSLEVHLNIAQYMKSNQKDLTVNYVDSDKIRHFLKMEDPNLPMRRFRIYLENNTKRRSEIETIKQVYINDNTISKDLESVAEVVASDSLSKIIMLGRLGRRQKEIQDQQAQLAQERQLAMTLEAQANEKQAERDFEAKENALKREFELNKAAIVALGFDTDKDRDNNNIPDVIEQLKVSIDKLRIDEDARNKEAERKENKLNNERKFNLENKKLKIEENKVQADIKKSEIALQIARENKNRYDNKKQ